MTTSQDVPDRIERTVDLESPPERVWAALIDSDQFGAWSGMRFDGPFVEGEPVGAQLVAAAAPVPAGEEGVAVQWFVERVDPQHRFVFRWHPFPVDHTIDYTGESMNVITMTLQPASAGRTRLTITESGFDRIPERRRADAYLGNSAGWDIQLSNLIDHLTD